MKKLIYLTLLLSAGLLTQCKKNSDIVVTPGPGTGTKPDPEIENPTGPVRFLKALNVTGAEKVVLDSVSNTYYVSLPDNYAENLAEVKLSMYENITLTGSNDKAIPDSVLNYKYAGTGPLTFRLADKQDRYAGSFNVYFTFTGTPKIELLSKEFLVGRNGFELPIRIISGVGTIYGSDDRNPLIKVVNRKTGFTTTASGFSGFANVYFEDALKLVGDDPIAMEIRFTDQTPVTFEGIKFIRQAPIVNVQPAYKFVYSKNDTLLANGGYFLENAKYTAQFSSDFVSTPVSMALKVDDQFELTAKQLPANLAEGSYLMSFFENGKLIGKDVIYVSETAKKSIETIWQGEPGQVTLRNLDQLSYKKGDSFYAKQSPPDFVGINGSGDPTKLPVIRLKNGNTSIDLKPQLTMFNWSIAGVAIPFGKYTIPNDFPSGNYEVIGVFQNSETKPYWSKLQVR